MLIKAKKIFMMLLPYLLILIMSLLGLYLVFYTGITRGHDYKFHMANIIEQYETLLKTGKLSGISGYVAMGLGTGTRLFYAPLPHFSVAILAYIFKGLNLSILGAYKIVLVLCVFISGVFMYRFALHYTNNNKIAALIATGFFTLYPYRIFDAFCRFALAEFYSITFLPLFFMGLYDITHFKDKVKIIPFVEVVLGGSLLFLSHNLTAFYAFVAGVLYLIFNIKSLIKCLKLKKYISYCGIAIVLLIGVSSVSLFSQFELLQLGIYNVSDDIRMWTNYDEVMTRLKEQFAFSGFLNTRAIASYFKDLYTVESLRLGLCLYVIGCLLAILADYALSMIKKISKFSCVIALSLLFATISITSRRLEIYLGAIVFSFIFILVKYFKNDYEIDKKDKLYLNPMLYFTIFMIIVYMLIMQFEWPWKLLPSFFLKIQFPWRTWALVQIFASMLVGLLAHYIKFKKLMPYLLTMCIGLLLASNNMLVEKRIYFERDYENKWTNEVDYTLLDNGVAIGFNKEYIPQVLVDKTYKPEYKNSLWYKIRPKILYDFYKYHDYYYDPVFLQGKGSITVVDRFADHHCYEIVVTEQEAKIQMAVIYYPGYEITIKDINSNETYVVDGENVDGLVAFTLKEGYYAVESNFVGSDLRQFSVVFTTLSVSITSFVLIYGLFFENKRRKENEDKTC